VASENVELVRRGIEAFNAGVTLIDDVFAADAELWPAAGFPEGGPFKGRSVTAASCGFSGSLIAMPRSKPRD
jgi:hypothetical protein